ncbi:MAG: hypothetical protein NZ898_07835 [Myxococcota bacterium]|nr:hypothetical protein [Myxococcota bacterium]MDW8361852.1 hypothetical protein [Myxococcales bacterium]
MRPARFIRGFAVVTWLGMLLGSAAGCSVDDDYLDDLYVCSSPSQCGPGWTCTRGSPYAPDFCAPRGDAASCEGVSTGGDDPACLDRCLIAPDGTPGACDGDGFSCVRTSSERDEGVCHPLRPCANSADCPPGEVCLREVLEAWPDAQGDFSALYCVPAPDEAGRCREGTARNPFQREGTAPMCWPRCTVADPRCPPAFGCLTQLHNITSLFECAGDPECIEEPLCSPFTLGLTCQTDANCFYGRCLDTGTAQGRICTMSCNEASRRAGGCENLVNPYSLEGILFRMECDPAAPSPDGSGLCVVRYWINFPNCTREPGSAYPCASSLECRTFRVPASGGTVDLCTRSCLTDVDCNQDRVPGYPLYQCRGPVGARICLFRDSD